MKRTQLLKAIDLALTILDEDPESDFDWTRNDPPYEREGRNGKLKLNKRKTERGFAFMEFQDRYGEHCTLQKSSLATEDAIWLGIEEPVAAYMKPPGWRRFVFPEGLDVRISGRMHLTQDDVKRLLPALQHFAETGELP